MYIYVLCMYVCEDNVISVYKHTKAHKHFKRKKCEKDVPALYIYWFEKSVCVCVCVKERERSEEEKS